MTNKDAITIALKKLINIGASYSSEKYASYVLEKIIRDLEKEQTFLKHVKVYPELSINSDINVQNETQIGAFINLLIAKLGVNLIDYTFRTSLQPEEALYFKEYGI